MANGTVKFFNPGKGFGFITPDGGAKDVFVPSASIATAGVALLKAGQRVSFEEMPDAKGPKAVNLKLLEAAPEPAPRHAPGPEHRPARQVDDKQVTLYCDPSQEESEDILAGLRDAGFEPVVADYIATPPTRDQLKTLASLLRGTEQSLARRYDHLFSELRLDDRFISENDFWDAIVEHPMLINGPVVTLAGRAAVCHSPEALKAFLAPSADAGRPKGLSPRLLKLMGYPIPEPEPESEAEPELAPPVRAEPQPVVQALPTEAAPAVVEAKPKAKAAAAKPASKPKPVAKAKDVAKPKPAAKPVKKSRR